MGLNSKKYLLKILLICVVLEIFAFNFKHFESLLYQKKNNYDIYISSGLEKLSEGEYKVKDDANAYFEITELNTTVHNLYIEFEAIGEGLNLGERLPILIEVTDEANSMYRALPETEVINKIEESQYIRLHLSGKSSRIKVNILRPNDDVFCISAIEINKVRPLIIHPLRIFILFIGGLLFLIFRPKSEFYNVILDCEEKWQIKIISFIALLHIFLFIIVGLSGLPFLYWETDGWAAHAQYEDLADALLDGHFYLNDSPPHYLEQMDNPYDSGLRDYYQRKTGEQFLFDFAYRDGKYYCYFGVVPALLFFVPYKLITGVTLQTWIPVLLCALLYCISSLFFMHELIKRYYPKTSLGMYLLLSSVYIAGSEILYLAHFGNVYSMPIILGLLLGVTGLGCWLKASRMLCMKKSYLFIGAFCIALIIGCRPQLAIVTLFAFPIFDKQIKNKDFFSMKGMQNTCSMLVPFFVVGVGIMYYNYARFGNPMDFGANYNLTSNDMTHRGIKLYRNFLGIYEYLLQPLNIKSTFPFMETIQLQTDYQGYTSSEPLLGGYFFMNLVAVFSFGIFKCKNSLKRHGVCALAYMSYFSAMVIILLTIQMSGLTQRYMCDFGWLLMIPTILVILDLQKEYITNIPLYLLLKKIIIVLSIVCIITNYFSLFARGRYASLIDVNPYMYYLFKYLFFHC